MTRIRLAALAATTVLALGLASPAAFADSSSTPPTVTQAAGGVFTVSLPGVGSITFSVDPATGAVSNLVATSDSTGTFTAGAPTVTTEGVQVVFTDATGATQVLQVEVEREDGAVNVKAETEADQTTSDGAQKDENGSSADSSGDARHQGSDSGSGDSASTSGSSTSTTEAPESDTEHSTTSTTEAHHESTTTSTTEAHTSESSGSGGSGGDSGSGGSGGGDS